MQILALINCLEHKRLKQKESVEGVEKKRDPTPSPNRPRLAHPSFYQICGHSVSEAQWEPTPWPQYSPYLSVWWKLFEKKKIKAASAGGGNNITQMFDLRKEVVFVKTSKTGGQHRSRHSLKNLLSLYQHDQFINLRRGIDFGM